MKHKLVVIKTLLIYQLICVNMRRCDHCYDQCHDLRSLSRAEIQDPWDHLPIDGFYCSRCYQRLSYHGVICRVTENNHKTSIDHIHQAIRLRQPFLWEISPFHEVYDLVPLIIPYKDDLSSLFHIIVNLHHFGYDRNAFDYISDLIYNEWFAKDNESL